MLIYLPLYYCQLVEPSINQKCQAGLFCEVFSIQGDLTLNYIGKGTAFIPNVASKPDTLYYVAL